MYTLPKLVFKIEPLMSFRFEGLSNFSASVEGLVQIEDVNSRI
jgi:hypothetical protein